ncbi:radical SAM/SPASM domain-containing protein [Jonesia denitrificans]|uniref:Radical SAM domain protein n=1 Tax=Jonesia denitrificans (strain ATCC 14870 / DSM 20603 / BCRC 15368 / CIP 55.134 / JCM 11481 / NBRC 15587 / NCTC 10816 / Prevot 55134) TaxID=471856 RepID=C7R574_JONDD|nr:radical SAM protein [Jonesia denitrificans]ACV07752.1 Radical SAM domain protein [Jonesia denitrificans DSM 20603]SQH19724.1 Anaerobic sulfatase-maturating enzyme homolog YdeM [Jonesia denitrificans]
MTYPYIVTSENTYVDPDQGAFRLAYHSSERRVFKVSESSLPNFLESAGVSAEVGNGVSDACSRIRDLNIDYFEVEKKKYFDAVENHQRKVKQVVIMPTGACNLTCGYCGQVNNKVGITSDSVKRLAESVVSEFRRSGSKDLCLGWFGGEPLMGLKRMVEITNHVLPLIDNGDTEFTSKVVTNGSLLTDRVLRVLENELHVKVVEVTLDGPSDMHDLLRPTRNHKGSFWRIVNQISRYLKTSGSKGMDFIIRTNVSRVNMHAHDQFSRIMYEAGLSTSRVVFYPAMVRAWGNDVSDVSLDAKEAANVELDWINSYWSYGLSHNLIPTSPRGPLCVAVDPHSSVIAPDGSIFDCSEQPLVPSRAASSRGGIEFTEEKFPESHYYGWFPRDDSQCKDCEILPICYGKCPLSWSEGVMPCPPVKLNLSKRLDILAQRKRFTPTPNPLS